MDQLIHIGLKMNALLKWRFNEYVNESFYETMLGVGIGICFYKFVNGLYNDIKKSNMSEENKLASKRADRMRILTWYIRNYINDGGKIEFSENYLYDIFKAGDVEIKIDKNLKTIFWTNIDIDTKKFGKWKPSKRIDMNGIHEYTEPIPISQDDIDELIKSIKEDGLE